MVVWGRVRMSVRWDQGGFRVAWGRLGLRLVWGGLFWSIQPTKLIASSTVVAGSPHMQQKTCPARISRLAPAQAQRAGRCQRDSGAGNPGVQRVSSADAGTPPQSHCHPWRGEITDLTKPTRTQRLEGSPKPDLEKPQKEPQRCVRSRLRLSAQETTSRSLPDLSGPVTFTGRRAASAASKHSWKLS